MQFKTNAECENCVAAIKTAVERKFPNAKLSLDLENEDKVLHVHGVEESNENAAKIESAIREAGFQGSWLTRGLENK